MSNPFDGADDDDSPQEINAQVARLERERLERQRQQAGQVGTDDESFAEEDAELHLGDEAERLPWLESDDDDYADDVVDTARVAVVAALGLLAVVALITLGWWFTRDTPDAELLAEGSTITAPEEPFRARPENPGGRPAQGTGDVSYEVGEGQDRETQMGAATTAPVPTATATPSAGASAAARPSIDRAQSAAAPAVSGVGVQVGAYSTRASADAGWAQLTRQHEVLSGVSHRILEAQVDGNTVFRLQAVSGTAASAETLCRAIKSSGGDCRVIN
jgi:hypothetical protein